MAEKVGNALSRFLARLPFKMPWQVRCSLSSFFERSKAELKIKANERAKKKEKKQRRRRENRLLAFFDLDLDRLFLSFRCCSSPARNLTFNHTKSNRN